MLLLHYCLLHNIRINKFQFKNEECIIHIDFGFILGISPGGNMNFENAPFKITKDYVNLMGGVDSSIFCYFKSLFLRGLFVARKNMEIIANSKLKEMQQLANELESMEYD